MSTKPQDPLLATAQVLLALFMTLFIVSIVLVGIGAGAVLSVQRAELAEKVEAAGLAPIVYWAIVAGILAIGLILYLALRFVCELKHIVDSVKEGDPFQEANAIHIERMAWLALATQVIGFPVSAAARYLSEVTEREFSGFGLSGGGFALVITLFILARVFRTGTDMREEIAGTV
jgi:hypothetical protein